jgi:hypothetical protein
VRLKSARKNAMFLNHGPTDKAHVIGPFQASAAQ